MHDSAWLGWVAWGGEEMAASVDFAFPNVSCLFHYCKYARVIVLRESAFAEAVSPRRAEEGKGTSVQKQHADESLQL